LSSLGKMFSSDLGKGGGLAKSESMGAVSNDFIDLFDHVTIRRVIILNRYLRQNYESVIRFQVIYKLCGSLKSSLFWYITPCSPLKVNQRFGGICGLHLQVKE
jgi:hypothetical protein